LWAVLSRGASCLARITTPQGGPWGSSLLLRQCGNLSCGSLVDLPPSMPPLYVKHNGATRSLRGQLMCSAHLMKRKLRLSRASRWALHRASRGGGSRHCGRSRTERRRGARGTSQMQVRGVERHWSGGASGACPVRGNSHRGKTALSHRIRGPCSLCVYFNNSAPMLGSVCMMRAWHFCFAGHC